MNESNIVKTRDSFAAPSQSKSQLMPARRTVITGIIAADTPEHSHKILNAVFSGRTAPPVQHLQPVSSSAAFTPPVLNVLRLAT